MSETFRLFAQKVSYWMGQPWAFMTAMVLVIGWALSGPLFNFSDTWELVINTATTIITFLMVFLIQNSQNRDMRSIHLKLDELIFSHKNARDKLIDIEKKMSESEMDELEEEYKQAIDELEEEKKELTTASTALAPKKSS